MQKLIFVLLILGGVAYAAQTRIKIGSSSWGYQIEQGPNIRTEFASEDGVASGFYQFRVGNETKKLEYRIDPNSREPDISFNVVNVDVDTSPQPPSPPAIIR
ncbi:hypothetical protein TYRP_020443 [Tyrophagus putrescentiae]|nr:hypothetical protein TYRP_020443 [Tyrophagus putrescentiae]